MSSIASREDLFNAQNTALVNKMRQKLKRTFQKLDDKGDGLIHRDAFFHTLNHFNVNLNQNDRQALKRQFDEQNNFLPFAQLVRNLTLNLDQHEWHIKPMNLATQIRLNTKLNRESQRNTGIKFNTLTKFDNISPDRDYDEKSITPSIFSNVWRRTQLQHGKTKSIVTQRDMNDRLSIVSGLQSRHGSHHDLQSVQSTVVSQTRKSHLSKSATHTNLTTATRANQMATQKTQQILNENLLMKSVIAKIKKYHLNPQILNTLRFSA